MPAVTLLPRPAAGESEKPTAIPPRVISESTAKSGVRLAVLRPDGSDGTRDVLGRWHAKSESYKRTASLADFADALDSGLIG